MKFDFRDQVVLVTGATQGIGKQISDDFAKLGARQILTGTNEQQIESLNRAAPTNKEYHCVDFTSEASLNAFLRTLRRYEKIDVCVNNAGINRISAIDETRRGDLNDIIDVNLKAPFLIIREVSRTMKRNGYGRIVNIASIFGVISREKRSIYSTTKFGLIGLTVASSNDLARFNILVNAVSPGFVLTNLTNRILSEDEKVELAGQVPARRLAEPSDISRVVVFMCSALNSYLTGQNIIVDGGFVNV